MKRIIYACFILFSLSFNQDIISGYLRAIDVSVCMDDCGLYQIEPEFDEGFGSISVIFRDDMDTSFYLNRFVEIVVDEEEVNCIECSALQILDITISDECNYPVNCFADPCDVVEECQLNTPIDCVSNYCGGCYADFYDLDNNLVYCYDEDAENDECYELENIDDCLSIGCDWDEQEGCFDPSDWEDEDNLECSDFDNEEECRLNECEWQLTPVGIGFCIEIDNNEGEPSPCSDFSQEDCEWFDECVWTDNGCQDFDWEEDNFSCEELSQDECSDIDSCIWEYSNNIPGGGYCIEVEQDLQECSDIDNQDECEYLEGCEWEDSSSNNFGYCVDSDENEDDNGPPECLLDCEGIEFINPEENPYETCDWVISNFGPNNFFNECAEDCNNETMMEINEYMVLCLQCLADNNCDDAFDAEDDDWNEDEDCDSSLMCGSAVTCWYDGLLYPTTCGPENCDEPIGECDDNNDNDWDDNENYCEGLTEDECWEAEGCQWYDGEGCYRSDDEDNQFDSCSDIENLEECENVDGCEWMYSNNMPGYGSCIDSEWENDDCDPDLACATVLTCYEDLLYPTSCGPENCDEPIGECEEDNEDGCFEDGEWYCIGCELFINDCEYLECTLNGWGGPYTLDNDECFNNDWECSDLGYEDCVEVDYCEWSSYVTPNGFFEGCIDIENDNDGPPECLMDCPGIEYILPTEENPYEACDWIISNFGPNNFFNECAYDCDEQTMMEIYEIVEACYECLENSDMDCSDIFNDNDDENNCFDLGYEECLENPNCQPNYNAAGQFEGCGYYDDQLGFGFLFGRVEFIYGDAIDFVSYATLHVESLPSNSDMVYFEVMTDAEGYYQIDLPVGAYVVTAFANEESLTQDIFITADNEHELNFLLGDWGGPWEPFAHLSLGAASGSPGADVVMPLYLSSSDFVGGVQFTIQPGIANSLMTEAIDSLDPCFEANFNTLDDGQVIGIIFSLEGCSYPPEEMLHIADLVFTINDSFQNGNIIELFFNNTIVSDSNGNEIPSYGEGNIITVGLLGDINGDFEINVLDVVIVINFALYIDEPSDSEFWASDINFDGMINVLDIVQLVNVILD